jgi:hypothetical protein
MKFLFREKQEFRHLFIYIKIKKMKKLILLLLGIFFTLALIQAQAQTTKETNPVGSNSKQDQNDGKMEKQKKRARKLEGSNVSPLAMANFRTEFGNIPDVTWERQDFMDVATFTKNGEVVKAYFGYDGQLVGTVIHKKFEDLPAKAQKSITDKYKDYTIGDVIYFTDNNQIPDEMVLYGLPFESADAYFVELKKADKKIVLKVTPEGQVAFFKELK